MSEDRKNKLFAALSERKRLSVFFLCLVLVFGIFTLACRKEKVTVKTAEFFVFDTVVDITAYGENAQPAIDAAKEELYRYNALLSAVDKDSDIYRINSNEAQSVSEETAEIIERSLNISELTDGSFDITVYPIVKLWGFTGGSFRVPEASEIEEALSFVGYEKVSVIGNEIIKDDPNVQIDLGATAKGYIGDKAAEAIKAAGCNSAVLSIGGNVVTVGSKSDGQRFNVGVMWTDGKEICATVPLKDISAVTSGTYQRNFTENGVFYHHIIDPKTGCPAESDIGSVTVFTSDGLVADGLSTAFFVMGSGKTLEFYESEKYQELGVESLDFMIIKNDGTCIVTENIYKDMSFNSNLISETDVTVV